MPQTKLTGNAGHPEDVIPENRKAIYPGSRPYPYEFLSRSRITFGVRDDVAA